MSSNAVVLLDSVLEDFSNQQSVPIPGDEAFELFCFVQCLKEEDLTADEIARGHVGGTNDGGIDGVFSFLDGNLLEEDDAIFEDDFSPSKIKKNMPLELVVVQAKRSSGFAESAFEKFSVTLGQLLVLNKPADDFLTTFSSDLVEKIDVFRRAWQQISTRHPQVRVRVYYASKGDVNDANDKINERAEMLINQLTADTGAHDAEVMLLGARELFDLAGQEQSYTLQLKASEDATASDSHLALVSLEDYFDFITDENGALLRHIFDWNVRDYEGKVEVNSEIARSLSNPDSPEFWWLNNGVTVICSAASSTGRTFSLDDVQIVNGLQTSMTIHNYLSSADSGDPARNRLLLVRIIVTDDYPTRDQIIRATNRQTLVGAAALRATEDIQRDLERYFEQNEWFYERRKNYYRNQGKSAGKIVTIAYLAQSVMAIGLSDPSNARARPSSLLKKDNEYERIFDPERDYAIYLWAATAQKAVDAFLRSEEALASSIERTNLRFHVSMLIAAKKLGKRVYHPSQLKALIGTQLKDEEMTQGLADVRSAFEEFTADDDAPMDRVVKNSEFTNFLIEKHFGSDGEVGPESPAVTAE